MYQTPTWICCEIEYHNNCVIRQWQAQYSTKSYTQKILSVEESKSSTKILDRQFLVI